MKNKLYTIKDTITGAMVMPFTEINNASLLRGARIMANAKKPNYFNENIKDKQIWELGTFDNQTGEIISDPKFLTNVIDLVETTKETKEEVIDRLLEEETK